MQHYSLTQQRKKKSPREPLRTLKELAEEFGVTWQELAARMSHAARWHNVAPAPQSVCRSGNRSYNPQRYYKPSEMRAWWKQVKEAECQKPAS